jgi:hypothetical protein
MFVKNEDTGTVINNDDNSFREYKMKREAIKRQNKLFEDVEFIKGEVISIKKILTEINNRLI